MYNIEGKYIIKYHRLSYDYGMHIIHNPYSNENNLI